MSQATDIRRATSADGEAILTNPWLTIGRVVWIVVVLALALSYYALASRGSRALLVEQNVEIGYSALAGFVSYAGYARLILASRYLVASIYVVTGLFIFWRKSDAVMGLLASLEVMMLPLAVGLAGQPPYYPETLNRSLSGMEQAASGFVYTSFLVTTILFIGLFPNGRFPFSRIKRFLLIMLAIMALILIVPFSDPVRLLEDNWIIFASGVGLAFLVAIAAATYRYFRLATPIEKQQMRWVISSLVLIAIWVSVFSSGNPYRSWEPGAAPYALVQLFGTLVVASFLPLAIARAITRYNLWDVDVVIRKTLVYTLLSGSLILIYLISVLVLQRVFTAVIGQDSALVTILSTLLIAALFLPLRQRIQNVIDRRFFRSKYDAARVLEAFASTARDETDLDKITAELLRVIQETMQPEQLSIWLRDDSPPREDVHPQQVTFQRYGVDVSNDSA